MQKEFPASHPGVKAWFLRQVAEQAPREVAAVCGFMTRDPGSTPCWFSQTGEQADGRCFSSSIPTQVTEDRAIRYAQVQVNQRLHFTVTAGQILGVNGELLGRMLLFLRFIHLFYDNVELEVIG